ncbi:methylenetetrahydrofolate reductase [Salpingoeca rosetta]|uniref:Methylenetetrahydrofolate reductase n=1 Tax=Salpingoeca rosetta (strain ATCC 50818 / BSB-021) TaxID=946362 RepID=F2UPH6_SALR5|nr:methylenetetrahydrofolate reductase [Salpingoeca rosetta]EGD79531.1 methylenetetrahydrofolate reductase [Salpingoeca rosetta]|eukprot:XP_004989012.1 methylenetetrahydrofolate reductase [Salpingoeca rosetta]
MPGEKIIDLITTKQNAKEKFISFEYFPPKTDDGVKSLIDRIGRYKTQDGLFMDMTWGAGGSTSDLTLDLCIRMNNEIGVESNMHLTCTNMDKEKVDIALEGAKKAGIRNIVALRGGYPEGHCGMIKKVEDGRELTETEKGRMVQMDDGIYVCSDEDFEKEMDYLQQKIDAGADLIITQMVFDADVYESFVKACRARGITVPIVPGIMCIQNQGGFGRMTKFCRSRVPASLRKQMEDAGDDKEAVRQVAIKFGADLSRKLLEMGAPGLHYYTLNLEKVTLGILSELGLKK